MAAISASMVKELRERTGLGLLECKKALAETDGDVELAIENLRKASGLKAAKKADRTAADRKSTRLNSSHVAISYAVFCLKKKKISTTRSTEQKTTKSRA